MNAYLAMALGIICAGLGGELFVRGTVGLAHWARIPPGIIGATVAAFATSSPELSVSVTSALTGQPQIALGDALGSNVVNIVLILGIALVISGIQSPRGSVGRDFPVALLVPVLTSVLFLDGRLSRIDGCLMLGLFATWLVATVVEARRQRDFTDEILGEHKRWRVVASCLSGLVFLVGAGRLFVMGAKDIALALGIDEFVIGATIVSVGTSVPELATTVIAKLRGHDEVSLGTILGSNIFNGIFIVPVAAIICPIAVDWREIAVALVFGVVAVLSTYPPRHGFIERRRGVLLLALYVSYLATILQYHGLGA